MEANTNLKSETFRRLAEKRTNALIEKIRILSHCSNRYYYEYTEADVRKIFGAIEEEIKSAKAKFVQKAPGKQDFRLT